MKIDNQLTGYTYFMTTVTSLTNNLKVYLTIVPEY